MQSITVQQIAVSLSLKKIKIKTTVKFRLLSHKTINEMINSKKIEYLKNRYPSNE